MSEPETTLPEEPQHPVLSLFVGAGAAVVSFLLILIVLVILTVATYQQGLKANRRDEETAKILLEIRHLQVLYAKQDARREANAQQARKSAEKAVARVSAKTDKFTAILKQAPARTVIVQRIPAVTSVERRRRHVRPRKASSPRLQRWEGRWDGQKWIGGWK